MSWSFFNFDHVGQPFNIPAQVSHIVVSPDRLSLALLLRRLSKGLAVPKVQTGRRLLFA